MSKLCCFRNKYTKLPELHPVTDDNQAVIQKELKKSTCCTIITLACLGVLLLHFIYDALVDTWRYIPWSLPCQYHRPSNNYNHHVCIGPTVVTKKAKMRRWKIDYSDTQLATTYQKCDSEALSIPFLVHNDIAYFERVDHHAEATPEWEHNKVELMKLDECARKAGDCFDDLQSKNVHLDARGNVLIIDATITPCFSGGNSTAATGLTNLMGSHLESFYIKP